MRRLGLIALALVFGLSLLVASVVVEVKSNPVLAVVEDDDGVGELTDDIEATDSIDAVGSLQLGSGQVAVEADDGGASQEVDYYLPYPGILPDHPFYWLKMVRDRVLLWFTREPIQKVERLLLYADKRVNAAGALAEGNQRELAVSTATKAEKYLERVTEELAGLSGETEEIDDLTVKVIRAHLKHNEVLEEISASVSERSKVILRQAGQAIKARYERLVEVAKDRGLLLEQTEEVWQREALEATESGELEASGAAELEGSL